MKRAHLNPAFDRTLHWALEHPLGPWNRYLVTAAIMILIAILRATFITSLLPWLPFVPAVLMIALLIGPGPGNFATLLAAALAAHSIAPPEAPYLLTHSQWTATGVFVVIGLGLVAVTAEMRAAFRRMQMLVRTRDSALEALANREAFLASVLESSTDCIKVLDLSGRITFMNNGGMRAMEVPAFVEVKGRFWPDFWDGNGRREAQAALAAALAGRTHRFVGRAATFGGKVRYWDVAVSPIQSGEGAPDRILSVARDITASRRTERDRMQLARIVETSADFIGMIRPDGSVFFLNDAACGLVGLAAEDVAGRTILEFFSADEAERVGTEVLPQVDRTGEWSGERLLRHFGSGETIPVLCTMFLVRDPEGAPIGYGTIMRDFRERKRAEQQLQLLNDELGHRLKNSLAVVQGIVSQSLRMGTDVEAARKSIDDRLAALAHAHDVLTQTSWGAAPMRSIVESAVGAVDHRQERVRIGGPDVALNARAALALAMALHELVTNAIKYGALSNDDGHVEIRWSLSGSGSDGHVHLVWREQDGPAVRAPTRTGFGSRLIGRALASDLGGEGVSRYDPSGFVWTLNAARAVVEHQ